MIFINKYIKVMNFGTKYFFFKGMEEDPSDTFTTYCHFCDRIAVCDIFEDETSRIACCGTCYCELIVPIYKAVKNGRKEEEQLSESETLQEEEEL